MACQLGWSILMHFSM
jgi:hypothetical protein